MTAIRQATARCPRDDCRIMERAAGPYTQVPTYDRNGICMNQQPHAVRSFSCLTCGESVRVSTP